MVLHLTDLPDELLTSMLVRLTGPDIKMSRLVCRRLANIVGSSPLLLFLIELDDAGYVEASNPRTDVSMEIKCSILRLHNSLRKQHKFRMTNSLKLGPMRDGFSIETEMLTAPWMQVLKAGVLAQWSSVLPDSYMPLQLDLARLPSCNTGNDLHQWRLTEHDLWVREFDIEPACDLLVLLAYNPPETSIIGGQNPTGYQLHFRTLSTNSAHPDSVVKFRDFTLPTTVLSIRKVQCLGDAVVCYLPHDSPGGLTFSEQDKAGLVLYDWTNGALLDLSSERLPGFLVAISKDVIIAPRSTFTYGLHDSPMGYLDIYVVDWTSDPSINRIVTLQLPVINTIPVPSPGLHGLSTGSTAIFLLLAIGSGCHFSSLGIRARGPAQIFEENESNGVLRLHINLPYLTRALEFPHKRISSCIYIPTKVIDDIIRSQRILSFSNVPVVMLWESWGPRTRWIHGQLAETMSYRGQLPGSRCLLAQDIRHPTKTKLFVLDFNPHLLEDLRKQLHGQVVGSSAPTGVSSMWNFQPAEANNETPTASYVSPHTWLIGSGADQAVAPYAWSLLENEALYRTIERAGRNMRLFWGTEHIVIAQGDPTDELLVFSLCE